MNRTVDARQRPRLGRAGWRSLCPDKYFVPLELFVAATTCAARHHSGRRFALVRGESMRREAGGTGGIKGNRHIATPMDVPSSTLLVSLANPAGVPVECFGDSTVVLDLDAVPTSVPPKVPTSA
jgi:hypothetical protein